MGESLPKKSILERISEESAPDKTKLEIYKLMLVEIGETLKSEDIAKRSILEIKTALNDVENGFIDLLNSPQISKKDARDIKIVKLKLIRASSHLNTAVEELGKKRKTKTYKYFRSIKWCKFLIAEINQQLESP